jgi:GT2 family glycosyltransferase
VTKAKVCVAWLHGGLVAGAFTHALVRMLAHDTRGPGRIFGGGAYISMESGSNVSRARNDVARTFLQLHGVPWLFMVDADMAFDEDALDRLMASAHPTDRPIVGGLCYGISHDGKPWPTLYRISGEGQVSRFESAPSTGLVEVDATGAACLLVHRRVFEAIASEYPPPLSWFAETVAFGQVWGEDITFCVRAKAAGFPIFVDCDVKVGHMKQVRVDDVYADRLRA